MQIGHANPELLGPAGLARTNAASSAGTVRASAPAASDPPLSGSEQQLDMDAFMSAWGSDDQTWDVDGSGIVDGTDLGTLLSVQSAASSGDADLQALLGAWGTSDPDWDFNADGIVDGLDLGVYLEGGVGDSPPASSISSCAARDCNAPRCSAARFRAVPSPTWTWHPRREVALRHCVVVEPVAKSSSSQIQPDCDEM